MNIILEGPDAAGKSVLADRLSQMIHWRIIRGDGPEKYPGEIHIRIARYLNQYHNGYIFDRHPIISQSIYSLMTEQNMPREKDEVEFYKRDNLFIYCRPNNPFIMEQHDEREGIDTKEYIEMLEKNYGPLVDAYDSWAMTWANMIYRIGNDTDRLIAQVKGTLAI